MRDALVASVRGVGGGGDVEAYCVPCIGAPADIGIDMGGAPGGIPMGGPPMCGGIPMP